MRNDDLDDLLNLAAAMRPTPSDTLLARVLADAQAEQPRPRPVARSARKPGLVRRLADAFGGMPVLAGLCSTAILGLALGYLDPTAADYLTGGLGNSDTIELFPTTDAPTTEG